MQRDLSEDRFGVVRALVLCGALLATGCKVEPAPADVDGIARWMWLNYEKADDDALADAIARLDTALGGTNPDNEQSSLTPLQAGDSKVLTKQHPEGDETKAAGMMLLHTVGCPLEGVDKALISLDQIGLHGGYKAYDRKYITNVDDYLARKLPFLEWQSTYTVAVLSSEYEATLPGGTRWLTAKEGRKGYAGKALFVRAHLKEQGKFKEGSTDFLRQDYQVQVFYEREPKKLIHLYGVWREAKIAGLNSSDDLVTTFTIGKFKDADDNYEKVCNK